MGFCRFFCPCAARTRTLRLINKQIASLFFSSEKIDEKSKSGKKFAKGFTLKFNSAITGGSVNLNVS
jgi:hypothetical protein